MMKKVVLILTGVLLAIALVIIGGAAKAWLMPPETVIPEFAETTPENSVEAGKEVLCRALLTLPSNMLVKSVSAGNSGAPGKEEIKSWRFDRIQWLITGTIRILETGKISGITLDVAAETFPGGKISRFQIKIPELNSSVPENIQPGEELRLAPLPEAGEEGDTPEKSSYLWWLIAGIILIVIILTAVILLKKKSAAEKSVPLDERTLSEIRTICARVKAGEIRAESGFALLSDTVRNYLEERSGLPVSRRTTEEFLTGLTAKTQLLNADERIYLTGFLRQADLIKFAGVRAGEEILENAASEAGNLVRSTTAAAEKEDKEP